jgi:hypothetical protein
MSIGVGLFCAKLFLPAEVMSELCLPKLWLFFLGRVRLSNIGPLGLLACSISRFYYTETRLFKAFFISGGIVKPLRALLIFIADAEALELTVA